jgi:hypothetical protein
MARDIVLKLLEGPPLSGLLDELNGLARGILEVGSREPEWGDKK